MEESVLIKVSKEEFDRLLDDNPRLARHIINQLASWLVTGCIMSTASLGIFADGRLAGQQAGVGPVENRIGHVGHFGPGGKR